VPVSPFSAAGGFAAVVGRAASREGLSLPTRSARDSAKSQFREGVLDQSRYESRDKLNALLSAAATAALRGREEEEERSRAASAKAERQRAQAAGAARRAASRGAWVKQWSSTENDWYYTDGNTGESVWERPAGYESEPAADAWTDSDDAAGPGGGGGGGARLAVVDVSRQSRAAQLRHLAALVYSPSSALPEAVQRNLFAIRQRHMVMLRVGAMYDGYTPRAYWWEAEELLRRLALSALIVLVPSGSPLQVATATLVAAFALGLLNLVEPYQDPAAQRLQQLAFVTILFTFWNGMLLKTDAAGAAAQAAAGGASDVDSRTDADIITALGVCMVILTIATIVVGLLLLIRDTARNILAASLRSARKRKQARRTERRAGHPSKPGKSVAAPSAGTAAKAVQSDARSGTDPSRAALKVLPRSAASKTLTASIHKVRFGLRATKNPAGVKRERQASRPDRVRATKV
jgi:hypothetical protein